MRSLMLPPLLTKPGALLLPCKRLCHFLSTNLSSRYDRVTSTERYPMNAGPFFLWAALIQISDQMRPR